MFGLIQKGQFEFPSPYWDNISDSAKNLIKQLLVVDPKSRMTADAIMTHPWMIGNGIPSLHLPAKFQENMKEFNARRRLKKAGYMVMAANRFKNILKYKQ